MASRSVKYSDLIGFTANPLRALDDVSLQIDDTDTYIFGGWIKLKTGAKNESNVMWASKGDQTAANISYAFTRNGNGSNSQIHFAARETNTATKTASTGFTIADDSTIFVIGWVDGSNVNLRVNGGSVISTGMTPSAFSDPGGNLNFIGSTTFSESDSAGDLFDEWFFCKNPPSLSAALSIINTNIYNGGTGTQYAGLSTTTKTVLGLISWWGMDESSGDRLDLHGSNDLITHPNISDDVPLVTGIFYDINLLETMTPSEVRTNFVDLHDLEEAMTLSDSLEKGPALAFMENIFLSDFFGTSPLLVPLVEEISLADWISIKRNPARSEWVS